MMHTKEAASQRMHHDIDGLLLANSGAWGWKWASELVRLRVRAGLTFHSWGCPIARPPPILLSQYLPRSLSLFLLLSWKKPRGYEAKWSGSEEGRPLAWCSGQTLQQRFLCSTHLLVLATAQIWPGFSQRANTAARPLYTGLFCKYRRQPSNVGMELEFWALDSGMVETLRKGHSHDIHIPINSISGHPLENWTSAAHLK